MTAVLSVIIPTLDEEKSLPVTLAALAQQQAHPWTVELIVVDGGSIDDTLSIAKQAGATILSAAPGRGQQLNSGALTATGKVLLFLHADVLLPKNGLAAMATSLEEPAIHAGCFRVLHQCSESAGPLTRRFIRLADKRSTTRALPYGDQAVFCTRLLYEEVGGIPKLPLMEDVAFARALTKRGKIARLAATVTTSARRFEQRPIRTTLCWWTFPLLARLRIPASVLAKIYGRPR